MHEERTTVKAILQRDDTILFVKDHKGVWELPGGRLDFGEQPRQALLRELDEELGLIHVEIGDVINVWNFTSESSGIKKAFTVVVFSCKTGEKEIRSNDEYTEYQWVPLGDIESLNMREGYKESIKIYLKKIKP